MKTIDERKEDFINKAKEVHSNENIDYSLVDYVNNRTKVIIIDNDLDENGIPYGRYEVTPSNFLKGKSHPRKRGKKIQKSKSCDFNDLIKRFNAVHKCEKLDYSKSVYVNMHTPILIIDHDLDENGNEYGEYWQEPCVHLKGCGCKNKGIRKQSDKQKLTTEEFIKRAKAIHGNKYDYSETVYEEYRKPVKIICNKHGEFYQTPDAHLQGKGCQKCGNHSSRYEDEITEFIESYGIEVIRNDRKVLEGIEIDIYIPSLRFGIEFNGLRWHTEWFAGKDSRYHLNKTEKCKEKGIHLLQIFEDEYVNNKDIVLNKIKHIISADNSMPKIMGRKCIIKEIWRGDAEIFLNKNHIQGYVPSTVSLGAFFNNTLIGVMLFKKEAKEGYWELTRFASDYHYICQGVGGKLFKYFTRKYNSIEIKSFADRRWTVDEENNIYKQLGFSFSYYVRPNYHYFNQDIDRFRRFHKFGFRKQKLSKKYGFPTTMTETEMAKELGFDRIWDCGLIKYVWYRE